MKPDQRGLLDLASLEDAVAADTIPPAVVFLLMQKPFMSGFALGQAK